MRRSDRLLIWWREEREREREWIVKERVEEGAKGKVLGDWKVRP